MRSATPKVLHPVCGLPMVALAGPRPRSPPAPAPWSSSARPAALDGRAPRRACELAVQARGARHGRRREGGRRPHRPRRHRRGAQRRRPAHHRRGDRRASPPPTRTAAPRRRWSRWSSTIRGLRARRARARRARSSGSSRPRRRATRPRPSSRSARSTPACTPSTAAPLLDALEHVSGRQRPGRVLPAGRPADPARRRPSRRARTSSTTRRSRSASTTASTSPTVPALAQRRIHEQHMRAGVTIVDPASTVIEADVAHRRGHGDRAVVVPARRHLDRGAAARSARSRR